MIEARATHILSPLGNGTRENYLAVKAGRSALMRCEERLGIPEPVTASMFSETDWAGITVAGYTKFESLIIRSVETAAKETDLDFSSDKTVFILATTKGDIDELEAGRDERCVLPGYTARRVAQYFGMKSMPVVVCNACISGVSAQLLAMRLLESGKYNHAVVCGADLVSRFTTAGFLSFKALSPEPCRPFDMERLGLNLGEAAAVIIFGRTAERATEGGPATDARWKPGRGLQTNDAYHVSAPHPAGEGLERAIRQVLDGVPAESLACINVHGTATMFNDQAESKAIQNAGLSEVPALAWKGYYGHTLGAAGVLETILTMEALDDGIIPANRGFAELGVSGKINISGEAVNCPGAKTFLKIMSGFGGCNAALLYTKDALGNGADKGRPSALQAETLRSVHLDSHQEPLTEIYKTHINDYPKFYKMDGLSKLVLLATHLLLEGMDAEKNSSLPVMLFNTSSSIASDKKHIATYTDTQGFYPSPSVFLYTLPNIALGEIAIRHHLTAETVLYILPEENPSLMQEIISASAVKNRTVLTGQVDYRSDNDYTADLKLVTYK